MQMQTPCPTSGVLGVQPLSFSSSYAERNYIELTLNMVHGVEDILMHDVNFHADFVTERIQCILKVGKIGGQVGNINQHDHGENILHNGLRNVNDICVVFHTCAAYLCKNADHVSSDYCNNSFHID